MAHKPSPMSAAVTKAEPANHRADAVQAFMAAWLPAHGVGADTFTAADAEALLSAVAHGQMAAD